MSSGFCEPVHLSGKRESARKNVECNSSPVLTVSLYAVLMCLAVAFAGIPRMSYCVAPSPKASVSHIVYASFFALEGVDASVRGHETV